VSAPTARKMDKMFGDFKSDMKQDFLKLKGIGSSSQPPGKKEKKKERK